MADGRRQSETLINFSSQNICNNQFSWQRILAIPIKREQLRNTDHVQEEVYHTSVKIGLQKGVHSFYKCIELVLLANV